MEIKKHLLLSLFNEVLQEDKSQTHKLFLFNWEYL